MTGYLEFCTYGSSDKTQTVEFEIEDDLSQILAEKYELDSSVVVFMEAAEQLLRDLVYKSLDEAGYQDKTDRIKEAGKVSRLYMRRYWSV